MDDTKTKLAKIAANLTEPDRDALVALWAQVLDEAGIVAQGRVPDSFPVRVRPQDGDTKLLTLVYNFAKQFDEQPVAVESRQDLAAWAIRYGKQHVEGTAYEAFILTVLREVYEAIAGEELETAANRHLRRFVASAGPLSALRCLCVALTNGAGLDGGFEDDPRSIVKYAVAVYNGERSGQ